MIEEKLNFLYDKFKNFMNELDVFNNIDEIYNIKHKETFITTTMININKRNTLEKIPNVLFSGKPQFNNIAGFEPVYNKAGQVHSPFKNSQKPNNFKTIYFNENNSAQETRENWQYDMLYSIYHTFHQFGKKTDVIITSMNEEWHNFNVNGPNDEFVTLKKTKEYIDNTKYKTKYPIKFLGDIVKPTTHNKKKICDENEMKHIIKHRIFDIGYNLILVNIHGASNMNGKEIVDEIIKLLKNIKNNQYYKNYKVILGGDSNVYYGNKDNISDINYLGKELNKLKYKLLISRHIVAKYRPYNFFQNAQSATKGGDWTNAETMIITYPEDLDMKYDNKHFIEVNNLKITDFYKKYKYGFLGTRYKKLDREEHIKSINSKNWTNNLYSDHIPIYCELNIVNISIRIIFTNNLSINSDRGINNNTSLFKIKDIKELEKISNTKIVNFFIKEFEGILGKVDVNPDKFVYLKNLLKTQLPEKIKKNKSPKKTKKNKKPKIKSTFKKIWNQKDNCTNFL